MKPQAIIWTSHKDSNNFTLFDDGTFEFRKGKINLFQLAAAIEQLERKVAALDQRTVRDVVLGPSEPEKEIAFPALTEEQIEAIKAIWSDPSRKNSYALDSPWTAPNSLNQDFLPYGPSTTSRYCQLCHGTGRQVVCGGPSIPCTGCNRIIFGET